VRSQGRLHPAVGENRKKRRRADAIRAGIVVLVSLAAIVVLLAVGLPVLGAIAVMLGAGAAIVYLLSFIDGFQIARSEGRGVIRSIGRGAWEIQETLFPSAPASTSLGRRLQGRRGPRQQASPTE